MDLTDYHVKYKQVLSRCEWGHDDYSLWVENLPQTPAEPGQQALDPE